MTVRVLTVRHRQLRVRAWSLWLSRWLQLSLYLLTTVLSLQLPFFSLPFQIRWRIVFSAELRGPRRVSTRNLPLVGSSSVHEGQAAVWRLAPVINHTLPGSFRCHTWRHILRTASALWHPVCERWCRSKFDTMRCAKNNLHKVTASRQREVLE